MRPPRAIGLVAVLVWAVAAAPLAASTARAAEPSAPAEPRAPAVPSAIDRAAICLRALDAPCALDAADAALVEVPGDDTQSVRREALVIRAQALALLDRADEARAAFSRAADAWPGWRPAPDADHRVHAAFDERAAAPRASAPPLAAAEPPSAAVGGGPDGPDERAVRPWTVSLGAGVALLLGDAASRYGPGIELALDASRALGDSGLALWIHGAVALFQLDDALPVEPGAARGLTSLVGAVGAAWSLPVHAEVDLVFAAGVGWGSFGLGGLDGDSGFALQASAGARWQVEDRLALRLDVAPRLILPRGPARTAGHTAIVLRGEARF